MSHDHSSVQYESRDTDDKKIFWMGVLLFAVMFVCSLLMIPFVNYLWHWAEGANPKVARPAAPLSSPEVILEVSPGHDLKKMQQEYPRNNHA